MLERLQKIIARAGVSSRRAAEALILEGKVKVNGKQVTELGSSADPQVDKIEVMGKPLGDVPRQRIVMLYKPKRVVTTLNDPEGRKTVGDLIPPSLGRLFPVGRLDADSEGLLLMTNDGELSCRLMHPRYRIPRVYLAKVKGLPDQETLQKIRAGQVRLEDGPVSSQAVGSLHIRSANPGNTWVQITLYEGRNREIRRLFEAVGHPVIKLKRIGYAGLGLEELLPGAYRVISPKERASLLEQVGLEKEHRPPARRGPGSTEQPPRRANAPSTGDSSSRQIKPYGPWGGGETRPYSTEDSAAAGERAPDGQRRDTDQPPRAATRGKRRVVRGKRAPTRAR